MPSIMKSIVVGSVLAFTLALGATAEAKGRWGVGLRTTAQNIASEADAETRQELAGGGLHLRFRATQNWGIELSAEQVKSDEGGGAFVRDSQPVTLAVSYHFSRGVLWDWYLLAGVGGTETSVTYRKSDGSMTTEEFVESHVHLGIGIERSFGPLAIGAELRAIGLARNPDEGDAPRYGDTDGPVPKESSGAQLNLAVTYYF